MSVANIVELGVSVVEDLLSNTDIGTEELELIINTIAEERESGPVSLSDEDLMAIKEVVDDELGKALAAWKELA